MQFPAAVSRYFSGNDFLTTAGFFFLTYPCVPRVLCGLGLLFFLIELRHGVRQPGRLQFPAPSRTAARPLSRPSIAPDLIHTPLAEHRLVNVPCVISLNHVIVVLLDHQPFVTLASGTPALHLDEREISLEPLAIEPEFQITFGEHRRRVGLGSRNIFPIHRHWRKRCPRSHVPHHDGASAVIALGNGSLEVEVRNWMIFHVHSQPLVRRIERWPLRHRP